MSRAREIEDRIQHSGVPKRAPEIDPDLRGGPATNERRGKSG